MASAGPYANVHLDPDRITMPAPHHLVFYRLDVLPAAQPKASKHCCFLSNISAKFVRQRDKFLMYVEIVAGKNKLDLFGTHFVTVQFVILLICGYLVLHLSISCLCILVTVLILFEFRLCSDTRCLRYCCMVSQCMVVYQVPIEGSTCE